MTTDLNEKVNQWMEGIVPWLLTSGIRIVIMVVVAFIAYRLLLGVVKRIIKVAVVQRDGEDEIGEAQRENTLIQIFNVTLKIVIVIVVGLMIASEFGIKIGPLLASAGIVGLAFGFGGQYLIRDLISGLFIILENQYRINDAVQIAGLSGRVERITLRVTTLRDIDGVIHYVPHGEIKSVSNLSKTYSRVNMDVGVAYGTDIDKVADIINHIGQQMSEDPEWSPHIITPPKYIRVQDLGDSAVVLKILGDTRPAQQWAVAGELRKRIYDAFNEHGIEIPFPQRVMHVINTDAKEDTTP